MSQREDTPAVYLGRISKAVFRTLVLYWTFLAMSVHSLVGLATDPQEEQSPARFNLSITGGRGLVHATSPYTLEAWEGGMGFSIMNFDRDPGDTDIVEASVGGALGIPGGSEFFIRFAPVLRTNSVNLDPLRFPVPPVDLVIDLFPTPALRSEPYFIFAQEVPYKTYFVPGVGIKIPGRGAFGSSSGDTILGLKRNILSESKGHWLGLGLQGYVEVPSEKPAFNTSRWRHKAGVSGQRDIGFDLLFSKQVLGVEFLLNAGYKKNGDPKRGIRIHFVNSSADGAGTLGVSSPGEIKLDLKDEVRIIAGATFPAFRVFRQQVWFVSEVLHKRFVSSGMQVQNLVHPIDSIFGLQFNLRAVPWLSLGSAWLVHWNSAGHGGERFSPFLSPAGKGDINFSEMVDPAAAGPVKNFLTARGVALSEGTSKIFATNNPVFDRWRNIPSAPGPVVSRGHSAAILFISLRPWRR